MKVAVDARHLTGGRGIAEYTKGMLTALLAEHPEDEWRAFVPGREHIPPLGALRTVRHALPSRVLFGAAALTGRPRLDRLAGGDVDVVWAPAPAPLAVSRDVPLVVTAHDVSWLDRPGDFTRYERLWHRLGRLDRLAERADVVVVNSAVVGESVRRAWGVPERKLRLIRPGIPARPRGELPPGIPDRFFLSVGALEPRKDPAFLARVHRLANTDAGLVFAGSGRLAPELQGPGVTIVKPTDAELGALYANAIALVSTSRLEGFGFPPLEAAAAGTPSVLTDLPAFRENLGDDGATFVPVGDEDAWVRALEEAAREPRPAPDVGDFRWDRAARDLRAALAEVAR